ncbi:hypothetical protein NS365_04120 [Aureimonas ureilytica]|uniref:Tip attachment protein J domain-containing protein n=2 Tax=Aureimonas ureilytica TaxID=401562 RepID=A0A175RUU6_9HYPH|nr:hypothetical protein NS365_04120 [Aureimonas ureilytica]
MLGIAPIGSLPLSTLPEPSARLEGRAAFTPGYKAVSAALIGSARLVVNADNRLFAATEDFISRTSDRIPSRLFAGTVRQALRFTRSLLGGGAFSAYTVGLGEMILNNASGEYDHLIGTHAVDGRRVTVKLGGAGDAYDSFGVIFDGQSTGWHVDDAELIVDLRDFGYQMEVPASPNTYAGTGGVEGGTDLKGKRKPLALGTVSNVTPADLTATTSLVFQVHDGPVAAIPAVYVRAAKLALDADYPTLAALLAAAIPQGRYATCLALGLFRLRFLLDDDRGMVTADVLGAAPRGAHLSHTAEIVRHLAEATAKVSRINAASFARVAALQPAPVGLYVEPGSEVTVAELCARLMRGIGGWVGFRRAGDLEVGILTAPSGDPKASFGDVEIIRINRETLPDAIDPPAWRYRIGYALNWTVQDGDRLADGITDERRAWLREAWRIAEASSDRVKVNHPLAQDPPMAEAYFRDEADARAEARRWLNLYRSSRSLYRATLKTQPFGLDLGDVIRLTYPRWDLADGKALRIVSLDEDTENNVVEVVAYG